MSSHTRDELEGYLRSRVDELRDMCAQTNPWVFLCAAAFISFLSKLAEGSDSRTKYPEFVRRYFPESYRQFTYQSGKTDLPEQLYHVLRCGVLHSFSLIPDGQARAAGGRDRSVVLAHRQNAGAAHLTKAPSMVAPDAALLVAEDLVEDVAAAVRNVILAATPGSDLERQMLQWIGSCPPISGHFEAGKIWEPRRTP